jgi:anti-sigma factor RsiW
MNQELQLKLQAYVDGELPAGEAREASELLVQDVEGRALVAELKNTRAALAGFEAEIKLPEGRDFYWSKIEREIQRLEKPETSAAPVSTFAAWRRFLIPASTFAALVIATLFVGRQFGQKKVFRAPETETSFADSGAFTYRDYASGMTLVWLTYPAENDFAETEPANTLD